MAELMPTATTWEKGLMPKYSFMKNQNSRPGDITKLSLKSASLGINILFTIVKNHENTGSAIGFLHGYIGGLSASVMKEGSYLENIKAVYNEDVVDIYFKCAAYTLVLTNTVARYGTFECDIETVTSIPENAVSLY